MNFRRRPTGLAAAGRDYSGMELPRLDLARTELDFLQRLLLDVQRRLARGQDAGDPELVAALELALALLRWDGTTPPELDAQVGLSAAVQLKLGGDGMCAYGQWRAERRRRGNAGVRAA